MKEIKEQEDEILDMLNKHKILATSPRGLRPLCRELTALIESEKHE